MSFAPYIKICVSLAMGAAAGTITIAFCRCEAHMPAKDEPAFPVDAATMVSYPFSFA